jgi:hypothetical protein
VKSPHGPKPPRHRRHCVPVQTAPLPPFSKDAVQPADRRWLPGAASQVRLLQRLKSYCPTPRPAPRAVGADNDARDEREGGGHGPLWCTPSYASAAALRGAAPRPHDDAESLCCVMLWLATGQLPW